jgi:hypothetical protein
VGITPVAVAVVTRPGFEKGGSRRRDEAEGLERMVQPHTVSAVAGSVKADTTV